jgi:hypothetical protein
MMLSSKIALENLILKDVVALFVESVCPISRVSFMLNKKCSKIYTSVS